MPAAPPPRATLNEDEAYRALQSRDARFDGHFFVGVTSTGIYCRPVCRVRLPRQENCRFFAHAATAEAGGFRPCLRCRPELAPGLSGVDSSHMLARHAAQCIDHAVALGQPLSMAALAGRLGVTERHARRIFLAELGVSPKAWHTTQRLLLAKRLLTDTTLPVTEVAAASGFGSLRRFHAAFLQHYHWAPNDLRRRGGRASGPCGAMADSVRNVAPSAKADSPTPGHLRLSWRPPYAIQAMQAFLSARPLAGVEAADGDVWRRTLQLHHGGRHLQGWLQVRWLAERCEVHAEVAPALAPALGALAQRLRHLLDLDADPTRIDAALATLPKPVQPGLRLPGCMDGFETTVRIILGQQVSVAAACTLAQRLVERLGRPIETPWPALNRLFPTAQALAEAEPNTLGELGIIRSRIGAIQAVARAVQAGDLLLHPGAPLADTLARLRRLPGIGEWTCELVALRVLAWPDAFPASDAGLRRALDGCTEAQALQQAQAWRPWRAYAVLQLWHSL